MSDRKVIVFSESAKFADTIGSKYPNDTVVYHSSIDKPRGIGKQRYKEQLLQQFESGDKRILSCVRALNEGYNVENVEAGIVAAFNSNPTAALQRSGRIARYVAGKKAIEINLVLEDTRSQFWAESKQTRYGNIIESVFSIDDIAF